MRRILIRFLIILCFALPALAQAQAPTQTDTEPRIQYRICDWGIIVIHSGFNLPSPAPRAIIPPNGDTFITITEPNSGASVGESGFTVKGKAKGLFENNLVVQVTNTSGETLFQQPVTYTSADVGGEGEWTLDVPLEGTIGEAVTLRAYAESAIDGSVVAEAHQQAFFNPLDMPYKKLLLLSEQDRILESTNLCSVAGSQADAAGSLMLDPNALTVISTRSFPPDVIAIADVEIATSCPYPLRGVVTRNGGSITIEMFIFVSPDAGCGQPIERRQIILPMGRLADTPLQITLNGIEQQD